CEAYASLRLRNALTREEIRAGAVAGVPLSLGISHCGLLTVSVDRADVRDVFGLCSFAVRADCARDTWAPPSCFPAQVALEAFPAHAQEDSRFSAVRRGEDFSETQSIRPYVPGDPVRQIHWKLSAKTGQTLLREIGLPQTGGILLVGRRWRGHTRRGGSVALRSALRFPCFPGAGRCAPRFPFGGGRRCPSHPLRTGNGRRACFPPRRRSHPSNPGLSASPSFHRAQTSMFPMPAPA
ncbi:MAG: DUF58 domain-containing protein, partial [Christensenellales bacterium]